MNRQNRIYISILIVAAALTGLNITLGRIQQPDKSAFGTLFDVYTLIQHRYVSKPDNQKLITGAIKGMVHELDPYSAYMTADEVSEFKKQINGSYEGIGVGVDFSEGILKVISPFENSPAYKAGVQPGDIITQVNGVSTSGWTISKAIKKLTGPAGTKVTLQLLHPNKKTQTVTIIRKKIHIETVRGWRRNRYDGHWDYMLDPRNHIGYIRIVQFTSDIDNEFDKAMQQLQHQGMKALIIDLRSNPGGLMSEAVGLVDRMVKKGIIVSTRGAHDPEEVQKAHQRGTYPYFPLVVMVDQYSASASEIVAGSLQDHKRAVIVGMRTWGKGCVQRPFELRRNGAILKLTTDYYYLPNGRCVHRLKGAKTWGVEPNIKVALDPNDITQLRNFMNKLMIQHLTRIIKQAKQKQNGNKTIQSKAGKTNSKAGTAKAVIAVKQGEGQQQKLLQLDKQLRAALQECKLLLNTPEKVDRTP